MASNGIAKIQHYVPQFVLKNFSSGKKPQVFVYDKHTRKTFKSHVKNVASENGFYDLNFEGRDLTIEPALSDIESNAAPLLKKITKEESLAWLSPEERSFLSYFFAIQFVRTKQHRIMWENLTEGLVGALRTKGLNQEDLEGYSVQTEEEIKFAGIQSVLKSDEYAVHFHDKCWILLKTTKENPFYISDNPICFQNMNDFGFRGNIGLSVKGIEIYFPINSNLAIAMYCKSIEEEIRSGYKIYQKLLFSNPILAAQQIKDPVGLEQIVAGITEGKVVPSKPENVININSLQVRYSSRFVFSTENKFSLVEEMLRDNPELKDGPRMKVN